MQNRNGLFWGIALVTLGLLFFGRNLGWFNFDWSYIRDAWPLLLILAGINLILIRRGNQAALVTTVLLAVAVPLALFSFVGRHYNNDRYDYRWHGNDDENNDQEDSDDEDDEESDNNHSEEKHIETRSDTFIEGMNGDTHEAVLKLGGGAARFTVGEPAGAAELIKADTKMTVGSYSMAVERDETTRTPTIELKPNEGHIELKDTKLDNRIDVRLNEKPVWTIKVGMGAGQGDFDLSRYDVKKLDIEVGAADLDLKLGSRAAQTDVKISSGVASITIQVPKEVACEVATDGALNLSQLDALTKIRDDLYQSPGYASASKKITIKYQGGMSKLKVVRY